MNKIKNIISIFVGIICIVTMNVNVFGHFVVDTENESKNASYAISENLLESRIHGITDIIDIKITKELKKIIKQYTVLQRNSSEIILGKVSVYFPLFENVFSGQNLPEEIKLLSIIESGLRPNAKSRVGATGLWQFMRGTGKMYGLKINGTVDQRRDPVLSTKAAANYLGDLYKQFGDWTLVLAAYNCGPGNLRKAIRKAGSKKYWELERFLPRETRRYIPKFIAMMYLVKYYEDHDLKPKISKETFEGILRTPVKSKTSFREVSKITGLTINEIKSINPSYIRNYIPNNKGNHFINLPQDGMFRYLQKYDRLHVDVHSFSGDYTTNFSVREIPKPETIDNMVSSIDELEMISAVELFSKNFKGKQAFISAPILRKGNYKLRKGETLMDVARRLHIRLEDLIRWNGINMNNIPLPGSVIIIASAE